jgi:hypothetical protein
MPSLCIKETHTRWTKTKKMGRQNQDRYPPRTITKPCFIRRIDSQPCNVSPQFQCAYDDLFESTTGTQARSLPKSRWQEKCGFSHSGHTDTSNPTGSHVSLSEPTKATKTISQDDQNDLDKHVTPAYITKSGRLSRPPDRLAFKALTEPIEISEEDAWLDQHPLAFKAKSDLDSMYYHQAMQQPDKDKFKKAMRKELIAHHMEGNCKLVKKSKIPKGALLLPPVWQLR